MAFSPLPQRNLQPLRMLTKPIYRDLMCGRFTQKYTWRELVELYRLTQPARNLGEPCSLAP
jgi:hypothetical protein